MTSGKQNDLYVPPACLLPAEGVSLESDDDGGVLTIDPAEPVHHIARQPSLWVSFLHYISWPYVARSSFI